MPINSQLNVHELVICANMIVRKEDKYLMIKRSDKKLDAPGYVHTIGGKIDDEEQPLQAAKRELLEEAGLEVNHIRLRGIILEIVPKNHTRYTANWLIYYFLGDYTSGQPKQSDEGEPIWLTKDEIVQSNLIPSFTEVVDTILDLSKGAIIAKFTYNNDMTVKDREIDICEI